MLNTLLCLAVVLVQVPDTNPPATSGSLAIPVSAITVPDTIRPRPRRPRPIEYSDAYAVRLEIHKIGSYTMLPLFAAEYALGQNLLNDASPPSWMKPTHVGVALGVGALFTVNTVTGAWNLWDSRRDPNGRTQRWVHATLMAASDAGFLWAAAIGGDDEDFSGNARRRHRNVALGSIGLSTVGTAMMWLWRQ